MKLSQLIKSNLRFYRKQHFMVALGIIISTTVLTGGLIVGESVQKSLLKTVDLRLGDITGSITMQDRIFTIEFAEKLANQTETLISASLKTDGSASAQGGKLKVSEVQFWGIDNHFDKVSGADFSGDSIPVNGIYISENFASALDIEVGDMVLFRMNKLNAFPANAPFVSDEGQVIARRLSVERILGDNEMGRLSTRVSQTAPYNAFVNISSLNDWMNLEDRCNILFMQTMPGLIPAVKQAFSYRDASIEIEQQNNSQGWQIESERIFIDDYISNLIEKNLNETQQISTYFVNAFSYESQTTPYSFIAGIEDLPVNDSEVIVNQWMADDLKAAIGDSIQLRYFVIGPLRTLIEDSIALKIKEVVKIEGIYGNQSLMPDIPGLSDAGSCSEWETGVPVQLDKIRDKDEDYWDLYRGTPKAYINLNLAEKLWKNRFGTYTLIQIGDSISKGELENRLSQIIDPFKLGMTIENLRSTGTEAAKNGVDFSQLFLGLSFFILAAGIILTILLMQVNLKQRDSQTGTLRALGFSKKQLVKMYVAESIVPVSIGSVLGVLVSIVYTFLIFKGLNNVWNDIVRTDVLEITITDSTLLIGFFVSVVVAMITIYFTVNQWIKRQIHEVQRNLTDTRSVKGKNSRRISMGLIITGILIIVYDGVIKDTDLSTSVFFISGGLLLIGMLTGLSGIFSYGINDNRFQYAFKNLVKSNLMHNRKRHLYIAVLIALATFVVIATGANRQDLFSGANDPSGGTGGFLYFSRTTSSVLHNMNNMQYRQNEGFSSEWQAIQFKVNEGDDASCLNLNRVQSPTIIATQPEGLNGRFSFSALSDTEYSDSPWQILNKSIENAIPAIADQTVIKWSLGKKLGDTLNYTNENGDTINLVLVGGLEASIFQGHIIISQENFDQNFPSVSGSNLQLIDGDPNNREEILDDLMLTYRDLGIQVVSTPVKLATFKSVENTYLSIFMVLGAFGLLIGIVGLAIVLQRNVMDRKDEISILVAMGFSNRLVSRLFIVEYGIILLSGMVIGIVTALISVYPVFAKGLQDFSISTILVFTVIEILNGLFWIWFIARMTIKYRSLS